NEAFELEAVAGAKTDVNEQSGMLTVSVVVPNSERKDLRVSVNDERILLSLAPLRPTSPYRIARRQDLTIPNPPGVDPTTAFVDRRGDEIRISFMEDAGS